MNKIQLAFMEAMTTIAAELKLTTPQLNLWLRFNNYGLTQIMARHQDKNLGTISVENFIQPKMIAARICTKKLTHFFRTIHAAYVIGSKIENPAEVSLVLYKSNIAQEVCVGIYLNHQAVKAFRLTEVIKLTKLGTEELN